MRYLKVEHLLKMHSFVVDETGGAHGLRDRGRLESATTRPQQSVFGKELFPTIFQKAAAYAHAIIFDHPFVDGNKRTAMTAALVFLEDNGFRCVTKEGEIHAFALRIVREKMEIPSIAIWLQKHTEQIRN
ncbi:MAG: type II toxin-antitoxin system death-on-curing family toxin [Patescibacteria group bacterium]|jgi:death-on-curing protein